MSGPRPNPTAEPLPSRLEAVLFAVVEAHVETAQPVASHAALERSGIDLSSASVRSLMSELTERGLLTQPHVSAGRIPTEDAYRLWVDALLASAGPAVYLAEWELADAEGGVDHLLRSAADLLSRTTGQLGFYLGRPEDQLMLEHIHFVRVASERVMALLVSRGGVVTTRVFEESDCDLRTLERVSARLSEVVAGLTLAEARAKLASAIEVERALSDQILRKMYVLGWESLAAPGEVELFVGNRNRLVAQPEFSDIDHLRALLSTLEEKEHMIRLLDKVLKADMSVAMGAELGDPAVRACAMVAAPLGPGLGGLGVIGPLRMPYDRVIPTVRYVCDQITETLC